MKKKVNQLLSFEDEEESVVLTPIVQKKKPDVEFKKDFEKSVVKKRTNFTFSSRKYNKDTIEELKGEILPQKEVEDVMEITKESKKIYKNENDEIIEEDNTENQLIEKEIKTFDPIEIEAAKNKRKLLREKESFIPLEKKKEDEKSSSSSSSSDEEAFDEHKETRIQFGVEEKPKNNISQDDIDQELENENITEWEELQMRSAGFIPKENKNPQKEFQIPKFDGFIPFDKIGNELTDLMDKIMDDFEKDEKEMKKLNQEMKEIQKNIHYDQKNFEEENVKYMFYQEMKSYLENLLDCLDNKVPDIEDAENEVLKQRELFYQKKKEMWIQYQKDKMVKAPTLEEHKRIIEFESMNDHIPNLIIDTKFFEDVQEEYNSIENINKKFTEWKMKFSESYKEAYVEESLTKVFALFVRLELLHWNPLSEKNFYDFQWFKSFQEHPSILKEIVKKVVFPLVNHSITKCYNPFSDQDTKNCVGLIDDFIKYKVINDELYIGVLERILSFIEEFKILKFDELNQFSKDQFFRGVQLVKNICSWKDKLKSRSIQQFLQILVKDKIYSAILGYSALKKRVLEVIPFEFQRGLE